jgi:uncharacterized membrane protein YhaH (DUF805 family)
LQRAGGIFFALIAQYQKLSFIPIFVSKPKLPVMNAFEYFVKVYKNYANFEGRARRSEYWYYTLFYYLIAIVLVFVDQAIGSEIGIVGLVFALGSLIPSIAVGVRRMHDVGKSGWYILIPIYNLVMFCTNGDTGTNEYGPDPKVDPMQDDINAIGTTE